MTYEGDASLFRIFNPKRNPAQLAPRTPNLRLGYRGPKASLTLLYLSNCVYVVLIQKYSVCVYRSFRHSGNEWTGT